MTSQMPSLARIINSSYFEMVCSNTSGRGLTKGARFESPRARETESLSLTLPFTICPARNPDFNRRRKKRERERERRKKKKEKKKEASCTSHINHTLSLLWV